MLRQFSALDGLPESDLISLAVFQNTLFIGTRTKGLLTYDGRKFSSFFFTDRDPQAVTAFISQPHKLLIGTFNGGLISYDGRNFTEVFGREKNERIHKITSLYKIGEQLLVGTFDNGMWLLDGEIERKNFTETDGLLSERIVGVARIGDQIYIGTDLGISETNVSQLPNDPAVGQKKFRTRKVLPGLSSLTTFDRKLLAVKTTGELFLLEPEADGKDSQDIVWENSGTLLETALLNLGNQTFLASDRGIFRINRENRFSVSLKKFNQTPAAGQLTNNTISAIAFDKYENLWLGTFRNGIDVLDHKGDRLKHIETPKLRDINFLLKADNGVTAATSQGVFQIEEDFQVSDPVRTGDLPGKSVMHVSRTENTETALATSRGFYLEENGRKQGFSTVQGLPGNNTYATLKTGNTTYVGTIGGLARIENGRVVRVYKDSNSELSPNWVTALCETNGRIFVGTYGGGIFELLKSGDLRKFSTETGKFFVNPNAMYSDGTRLFAGTLKGLRVFDLKTEKWSQIREVLPSEIVLSVAGNSDKTYIGTTAGVAVLEPEFFE